MKTKLILSSLLLGAVLFNGCKKEDEDNNNNNSNNTTQTKKQMLTAKPWKMTGATIDPAFDFGAGATTDMFAQMDACEKDNLHTLKTDMTYVDDEGATKCDPSDPQTDTGTWAMNPAETILIWDGTDSVNIVQLTSATLKISTQEDMGGTVHTLTFTMTAQ